MSAAQNKVTLIKDDAPACERFLAAAKIGDLDALRQGLADAMKNETMHVQAINVAIENQQLPAVSLLLEGAPAPMVSKAAGQAAALGTPALLELFAERTDISEPRLWSLAIDVNNLDNARFLQAHMTSPSPIHRANALASAVNITDFANKSQPMLELVLSHPDLSPISKTLTFSEPIASAASKHGAAALLASWLSQAGQNAIDGALQLICHQGLPLDTFALLARAARPGQELTSLAFGFALDQNIAGLKILIDAGHTFDAISVIRRASVDKAILALVWSTVPSKDRSNTFTAVLAAPNTLFTTQNLLDLEDKLPGRAEPALAEAIKSRRALIVDCLLPHCEVNKTILRKLAKHAHQDMKIVERVLAAASPELLTAYASSMLDLADPRIRGALQVAIDTAVLAASASPGSHPSHRSKI